MLFLDGTSGRTREGEGGRWEGVGSATVDEHQRGRAVWGGPPAPLLCMSVKVVCAES